MLMIPRGVPMLVAAAAMLMTGGLAAASQVMALDLEALAGRAERIVVGEVLSTSSAWDTRRERILTTVVLQVAESWKGDVPGDGRLTIVQPGGVADGIEMRVHGLPSFQQGERAVLFLRGARARGLSVVGMGQGKRAMNFETAAARWMVSGGDRSAAVVLRPDGRTTPAAPELPMPLDELRRRVRAMVKK